jgi:hypothetical protein
VKLLDFQQDYGAEISCELLTLVVVVVPFEVEDVPIELKLGILLLFVSICLD